jgi:hypothetical protein
MRMFRKGPDERLAGRWDFAKAYAPITPRNAFLRRFGKVYPGKMTMGASMTFSACKEPGKKIQCQHELVTHRLYEPSKYFYLFTHFGE